jgi:5-oxoprolinase (ATP-hydrolysing) subunit A
MVRDGHVTDVEGGELAISAETICVHGDGPHAAAIARALREGLEGAGVTVAAPGGPVGRGDA